MHAMAREFSLLNDRFDLLVVGGGIYGAWIAYDAALRGLRTALVERDDWAAGTSSASSKLIHGGLRYLEYGQLALVRKALAERSRLLRLAPHRVRPLRFHLPVYHDSRAGRIMLELGLSLYDLLAGTRSGAPAHRAYSRDGLLEICPFLRRDGLRAGFAYADASEDDARFTLEIVAGAAAAGAVVVNHAEATGLLADGARVDGATVRDRLDGRACEVRAEVTVAAVGPWLGPLLEPVGAPVPSVRMTKGVHLVMPPLPAALRGGRGTVGNDSVSDLGKELGDDRALLLTARTDKRVFFLIPWYGATLLGTTDTDWRGDARDAAVEPADVAYLLRETALRCPGLRWSRRDVRGCFVGVRTLQGPPPGHPASPSGTSASAATREWTLAEPRERLLAPIGGKFTSARVEAALTVDRVAGVLGRPAATSITSERDFPWKPRGDFPEWLAATERVGIALGLDPGCAAASARRHGSRVGGLHRLLEERPGLAARISEHAPFCLAEASYAVTAEMARSLDDVLRRRVPAGILCRLGRKEVARVATLIGPELGWNAARADEEATAWHERSLQTLRMAGLED